MSKTFEGFLEQALGAAIPVLTDAVAPGSPEWSEHARMLTFQLETAVFAHGAAYGRGAGSKECAELQRETERKMRLLFDHIDAWPR